MQHICHCPIFEVGAVVNTIYGEVKIDAYLGNQGPFKLPTYRVISANVRVINGRPVNIWRAQMIPILTLTGVDPDNSENIQEEMQ